MARNTKAQIAFNKAILQMENVVKAYKGIDVLDMSSNALYMEDLHNNLWSVEQLIGDFEDELERKLR